MNNLVKWLLILVAVLIVLSFISGRGGNDVKGEINILLPESSSIVKANVGSGESETRFEENGTEGSLVILNNQSKKIDEHTVIPFVVNHGGTGSFVYIGLFKNESDVVLHLSSSLVGDRVEIKDIKKVEENIIAVDYLGRAEGAPFSSPPDQNFTKLYGITDFGFVTQ